MQLDFLISPKILLVSDTVTLQRMTVKVNDFVNRNCAISYTSFPLKTSTINNLTLLENKQRNSTFYAKNVPAHDGRLYFLRDE